ncbi:MAG: Exopolyphosphatase [Bathelium mastoideum]|nr:MAG: Exopolyphosphatase [Bathelium mastoideum]
MSAPGISLKAFLSKARSALQSAREYKRNITLVIGNESADLDSFTCSLLYAYIRSTKPPRAAFSPTYVPLLNIPRADIALRPELLTLLPSADLSSKDIITLSDLPDEAEIETELPPQNTRWILVDHNSLQGSLGSIYGGYVAGVVDHHEEENQVPQDTGDEARIVEKAGSCTSLVANYLRGSWESSSILEASLYDAQAAKLALASILIDTTNLKSKGKVTPHDEEAVKFLETKIAAGTDPSRPFDRTAFFEEISQAKLNIGSLKLKDILRKDYKQWTENGRRLGISSVVKPISFLQQKADAEEADSDKSNRLFQIIDRFCRDRHLELYAIMTTSTSTKGEFQRELLVKAFTETDAKAVKKFADKASDALGLEDWENSSLDRVADNEMWTKVWWQRKIEHSRKLVAPLLRAAMS